MIEWWLSDTLTTCTVKVGNVCEPNRRGLSIKRSKAVPTHTPLFL